MIIFPGIAIWPPGLLKLHDNARVGIHEEDSPRGGGPVARRATEIHSLTDATCRPVAFLLDQLTTADLVQGDKGYDTNAVRRKIEAKGTAPNIPPKVNRRWKSCFSPYLYRSRNAIERMFGRPKDFRRIATRYDRRAVAFLSAVRIAAIVSYWL
jgi:transposase